MRETLLDVQGMSCQSCARHVNQALVGVEGVQQADVRLDQGCVLVTHAPDVAIDALVAALAGAGYASRRPE